MQVSNIQQNQPNFNGRMIIKGVLNYTPAKALDMVSESINKRLAKKDYDLFVEENHTVKTISFVLQNSNKRAFMKYETVLGLPPSVNSYAKTKHISKIYDEVVKSSIKNYDNMLDSMKWLKLKKKFVKTFDAITDKFWKMFSDGEEV